MIAHEATDTRPRAWHTRLDDFFAARMRVPFGWGAQDCCLFAADAVVAMDGVDHAAAERGTYGTAKEAMRLLANLGGLEAVAARAGPEIAPLQARTGDIGLVSHSGQQLLGVCCGSLWLVPAATGLAPLELKAATRAWRVPHG